MPRITFYITSHGFGHSTREIEVINHIPPSVEVEIVTAVPRWLFERSLSRPFAYREQRHDPGIIQHDSLHQDLDETHRVWTDLLQAYPAMAEKESKRVLEEGTDLVVGDISPFAVAVGRRAGLPSAIVANFSWDWIMESFLPEQPAFARPIETLRGYFGQCDLLLRTPLSGDLSVFPRVVDVSLIVRRSRKTRDEARAFFGLCPEDRVVLISFGGHGFERIRGEHLERYPEIVFLTFDRRFEGLANARVLDPVETYHPDALHASDLVLSKLGYGIVTECIAHRVPMAYPPRRLFPEYDVLEREMPKYVDIYRMEEEAFFGGQWDILPEVLSARSGGGHGAADPAEIGLNGGEKAAVILTRMAEGLKAEDVVGT